MGVEDVFDLPRVHVHAVPQHHVGHAISDVEVAVLVEPAHVADGERSVAPCRVGLGVVAVVMKRRSAGGLDVDHAVVAVAVDADLHAGPRFAHGAGTLEPLPR